MFFKLSALLTVFFLDFHVNYGQYSYVFPTFCPSHYLFLRFSCKLWAVQPCFSNFCPAQAFSYIPASKADTRNPSMAPRPPRILSNNKYYVLNSPPQLPSALNYLYTPENKTLHFFLKIFLVASGFLAVCDLTFKIFIHLTPSKSSPDKNSHPYDTGNSSCSPR